MNEDVYGEHRWIYILQACFKTLKMTVSIEAIDLYIYSTCSFPFDNSNICFSCKKWVHPLGYLLASQIVTYFYLGEEPYRLEQLVWHGKKRSRHFWLSGRIYRMPCQWLGPRLASYLVNLGTTSLFLLLPRRGTLLLYECIVLCNPETGWQSNSLHQYYSL